ncbi:hypothetical protein [Flavobacterium macrobrachii]|uniref:Copper chaperone NosL n=1 Tax=Flavobacterium macrobrachii TaxID=591204 RepID=A0ABS2CUT5_9FLAO|nr:hypothetical protein [Flavobacterium macrobrachii]MBM6498726.1 hypothetical protein [Flavobacterium macrobrachii]
MKIYICIFLFSLLSCENNNNKYKIQEEALKDLFKKEHFYINKKAIIIIPAMGCGSCTSKIIDFSKKEINNDSLLFIYSDLTNKTDLIFKNIKTNKKNFFKDSLSLLISRGLLENKPIVYFTKSGRIDNVIKFDDTNVTEIIEQIKK